VAVITIDDGRVNAMTYEVVAAMREGFALAATQASAVVFAGRDGAFTAGFDLTEIVKGETERNALIRAGGELFYEIFTSPLPVVVACPGHAVAGGAVFLLVADTRVGRVGKYRIGFNEIHIGVPMPEFAIALTQYRVLPTVAEAALLGDMLDPTQACDAGFLDIVVDGPAQDVVAAAIERARELGARPAQAYGPTKLTARKELIDRFADR